MGMTIEDIKHCLKVMVDCEVCEECNLYGTTGTDHCEHDCVCGALDIINKYQKIEQIAERYEATKGSTPKGPGAMMKDIIEIVKGEKE